MPKVKITMTFIYDLDISWINPKTDKEHTEDDIKELAEQWALGDLIEDDNEAFQQNPDMRHPAILSALLDEEGVYTEFEIIREGGDA